MVRELISTIKLLADYYGDHCYDYYTRYLGNGTDTVKPQSTYIEDMNECRSLCRHTSKCKFKIYTKLVHYNIYVNIRHFFRI